MLVLGMTVVSSFTMKPTPVGGLARVGERYTNGPLFSSSSSSTTPCPLLPPPSNPQTTAEFAMGWFWGPQRDFDRTEGIIETVVGYSGSQNPQENLNPTYKSIQDYAESIRITFDSSKVDYADLLSMFFAFHTPADPRFAGTQYRSAIFVQDEEQRFAAQKALLEWGALGRYVSIEDASDFYRAEEYHQKYMEGFGV